jgi:hypothetical protein
MRIPVRFKQAGLTIKVKWDPKKLHNDNNFAHISFRNNEIVLMPSTKDVPRPQDLIEQDFCHELTHHIASYAEGTIKDISLPLHRNEEFTNVFSALLHQALTTMEYEKKVINNK